MPATLHLEWELPEGALEEPFRTELVQAVKREVAVRLFADGKIISGYGAGMLGISRWEFIDLRARDRSRAFTTTWWKPCGPVMIAAAQKKPACTGAAALWMSGRR